MYCLEILEISKTIIGFQLKTIHWFCTVMIKFHNAFSFNLAPMCFLPKIADVVKYLYNIKWRVNYMLILQPENKWNIIGLI